MIVVEAEAGGIKGIGYTYSDVAAGKLIESVLSDIVRGQDAMAIGRLAIVMVVRTRNLGHPGIVSTAIAAVDNALWDLKGKFLNQPLGLLLGPCREGIPVYGSGGFTSYPIERPQEQLEGWAAAGIRW